MECVTEDEEAVIRRAQRYECSCINCVLPFIAVCCPGLHDVYFSFMNDWVFRFAVAIGCGSSLATRGALFRWRTLHRWRRDLCAGGRLSAVSTSSSGGRGRSARELTEITSGGCVVVRAPCPRWQKRLLLPTLLNIGCLRCCCPRAASPTAAVVRLARRAVGRRCTLRREHGREALRYGGDEACKHTCKAL